MNKIKRLQELAGIQEIKVVNPSSTTADTLFKMFQDEDLINDRREYDEEDLMAAYPDLSREEAEKLVDMLQNED